MPHVRRHNLPPQLLAHLVDRVSGRNISADQLGFLADWLYAEPQVPEGKWFKKFSDLGPSIEPAGALAAGVKLRLAICNLKSSKPTAAAVVPLS